MVERRAVDAVVASSNLVSQPITRKEGEQFKNEPAKGKEVTAMKH
jgi:hypothetical protein